jgi:hypothetical protein
VRAQERIECGAIDRHRQIDLPYELFARR